MIYSLHKIGLSNKNISDFLNYFNLRTLRTNKIYTPKLIWGTLHKYKKRLNRNLDKIIWVKESLNMSVSKKNTILEWFIVEFQSG